MRNLTKKTETIYRIEIGSPVDYEELVAYIIVDGDEVVLLNQDSGKDNIKVEFLENQSIKSIGLDDLFEALKKAKEALVGDLQGGNSRF